MIEETTQQKTTQEWLEIFEGSGMPYAAVNDIQGTLNHKHGTYFSTAFPWSHILTFIIVLARNMVTEVEHPACGPIKLVNTPIKYSEATPGIRSPPPTLGQHTDEILGSLLDYEEADIARMKSEGIIS